MRKFDFQSKNSVDSNRMMLQHLNSLATWNAYSRVFVSPSIFTTHSKSFTPPLSTRIRLQAPIKRGTQILTLLTLNTDGWPGLAGGNLLECYGNDEQMYYSLQLRTSSHKLYIIINGLIATASDWYAKVLGYNPK